MFNILKLVAAALILCIFSSFTPLPSELGNAVIIDDSLDGKVLTCGLKYDKSQNVAAHKTLPCGTKVRVTVLSTNKSIELTIIDSGTYLSGQIIAISSNAAAVLGISNEMRVKVENLDEIKIIEKTLKKNSKTQIKKSSGLNVIEEAADIEKGGLFKMQVMKLEPRGWGVQVATYSSYESVVKQLTALHNNWFKGGLVFVDLKEEKPNYKIIMGPFFTREEAESYLKNVREKYKINDAFIVDLNMLNDSGK